MAFLLSSVLASVVLILIGASQRMDLLRKRWPHLMEILTGITVTFIGVQWGVYVNEWAAQRSQREHLITLLKAVDYDLEQCAGQAAIRLKSMREEGFSDREGALPIRTPSLIDYLLSSDIAIEGISPREMAILVRDAHVASDLAEKINDTPHDSTLIDATLWHYGTTLFVLHHDVRCATGVLDGTLSQAAAADSADMWWKRV